MDRLTVAPWTNLSLFWIIAKNYYTNFFINLNQATFNYNNNQIKMAPSTPIRNSNPNVAKVTASPAARKGIQSSPGNDSISPMQRCRLVQQSRRERHQAILEDQARATIRINRGTFRYLKPTRMHLYRVRNLRQRVARRVIGNAVRSLRIIVNLDAKEELPHEHTTRRQRKLCVNFQRGLRSTPDPSIRTSCRKTAS